MSWFLIILAGLLEACWAVGLKLTDGFTRLWPSVFTLAAILASMFLLGLGARTLPIGTAYAVWVGIGTVGAALIGILRLGEPATPARLFFLALLVASVVGLKLTTPGERPPPPDERFAPPPGEERPR